jgi:hypothetical protein
LELKAHFDAFLEKMIIQVKRQNEGKMGLKIIN